MNRPLKFRVWNRYAKEWLFPNPKIGDWSGGSGSAISLWCYEDGLSVHSISRGTYYISQFTGLQCRSRDIYEGDVLNTKAARWVVEFSKGAFVAKVIWSAVFPIGRETPLALIVEHAIPLGNMYENPEMLEVGV